MVTSRAAARARGPSNPCGRKTSVEEYTPKSGRSQLLEARGNRAVNHRLLSVEVRYYQNATATGGLQPATSASTQNFRPAGALACGLSTPGALVGEYGSARRAGHSTGGGRAAQRPRPRTRGNDEQDQASSPLTPYHICSIILSSKPSALTPDVLASPSTAPAGS